MLKNETSLSDIEKNRNPWELCPYNGGNSKKKNRRYKHGSSQFSTGDRNEALKFLLEKILNEDSQGA